MQSLAKLRRLVGPGLLLGLITALIAGAMTRPVLIRVVDEWVFDGWFHVRGARQTRAKIVLIGLDDASLRRLGKPAVFLSPELAELVVHLEKQGAAAVGIDLIVEESLQDSPRYGVLLEGEKLGQAIFEAGNVVLSKRLSREEGERDRWLLPLAQWRFKSFTDRSAPTDLGFVNLDEDRDHFFRRQQLFGPEGDLHFALALDSVATRRTVRWERGLWIGEEQVPMDEEDRLRINFVGPPGSFPVVPFYQALEAARTDQALPEDVRGAVVIIGFLTRSQQDFHATPYGNRIYTLLGDDPGLMSGPELHGHIVATLVDSAPIRSLHKPFHFVILLATGVLLGKSFARLDLTWGALLTAACVLGWLALSLTAFWLFRLRVEVAAMLLLFALAYAGTFAFRWRRLRRMLGVIKSEAIARALEADSSPLELKGEARVVTVLFADVRGFTDFSERHTPQQAVALLNGYFGAVVPIIEAQGGTLNLYVGDGVMVIFGAPTVQPDHALRAAQAAVAMVRRVRELSGRWAALDCPNFRIGVGIHTGEVVVGTVGSPSRLDYTAIGDTVNAASRIESENKRLGSDILLSDQTYAVLRPEDRVRLGVSSTPESVVVKGKSQVLSLHRVAVPPTDTSLARLPATVASTV